MKEGFEDLGLKNIEISDIKLDQENLIEKNSILRERVRKFENDIEDSEICQTEEVENPKVICDQLLGPGGKILVSVGYECPSCNKIYNLPPEVKKKVNNLRPSFYYYCRECGKELGCSY